MPDISRLPSTIQRMVSKANTYASHQFETNGHNVLIFQRKNGCPLYVAVVDHNGMITTHQRDALCQLIEALPVEIPTGVKAEMEMADDIYVRSEEFLTRDGKPDPDEEPTSFFGMGR